MTELAVRQAVVLLMNEALARLESSIEGSTYRTPGHLTWLEGQRAELKRLIAALSPTVGFGQSEAME